MNQQTTSQHITYKVQKTKSSAPVICGAIGFLLGLPGVLCATLCAAVVATASAAPAAIIASDPKFAASMSTNDIEAANAVGVAAATTMGLPLIVFISCWLLGFILCFFGKSGISKIAGILMILAGVGLGIPAAVLLNFFGLVAAILYIFAGGMAIAKASRPE